MTIHVAVRSVEEPQGLLAATLDAVPSPVAVLDEAGSILFVNESWREFLRVLRIALPRDGVGTNYLKAGILSAIDPRHVLDLRVALKQVLRGALERFQRSVCLQARDAKRWYQVSAVRVTIEGASRVVVTHADISAIHDARQTIKDLSQRLLSVQDEERQRIALELHDSTAQQLTAIGLHMMALRRTSRQDAETQHTLDQVEHTVEEAQKEIRTFSYLLHPPCLDEDGLKTTLTRFIDGFARRTGLRATAQIDYEIDAFTPEAQRAILRIVQQALANVHRHASATEVRVRVETTQDMLVLSIADNGKGMAVCGSDASGAHRPGVGLAGMRERLRQLGGALKVASGPQGTTISGAVPLSECREELPLLYPSFHDFRVLPLRVSG
jgi:two-component system, NarL family, sensor kinase